MAKRLMLVLLTLVVSSLAWGRARVQGNCEQGGQQVAIGPGTSVVQTTGAATYWQQSFPACAVAVYATGTLNLATIYADNSGTPKANPFTASSTDGLWFFYADNGRYDVRLSGGGIATPFTRSDFLLYDPNATAPINVMLCGTGVVGDGVTDDGPAIRACAYNAANAGAVLIFPKQCHTNGCIDYFIGTADTGYGINLTSAQSSVSFLGEGPQWFGGVTIKFAPGMGGFHIRNTPSGGLGSGFIHYLSLLNTDFDLNTTSTWGPPGNHHGIWYEGSQPDLAHVSVEGFDGDAVLIDSTTSFAPDLCTLNKVSAYSNKGNGIHLTGNDANVCKLDQPNVRLNQLWGIKLENEFGGVVIAPHADANHHDVMTNMSAGIALTSCQRVGILTTCTTGVNHGFVSGDNIQQIGCADTSFNGFRWRIAVTGLTTYTYYTINNESTVGGTVNSGGCGTVKYSIPGRVWSSNSLDGGPFWSIFNSVQSNQWIGIYTEGSAADQESLISNNDNIYGTAAWLGNRPEQTAAPAGIIPNSGSTVPMLSYTTVPGRFLAPHPSSINPATGLKWNAQFTTGSISTGLDAAWGFQNQNTGGQFGQWVRTTGTGTAAQAKGSCSSNNNGYAAVVGQWGFRINSATDTDFCIATPFWISEFNAWGQNAADIGFPNGWFFGSNANGAGTLRHWNIGNAFATDPVTGDLVGSVMLKTAPTSGGILGQVCVTAGSPCTTARAFAPISNDATGTSWTLPVLNASTSFTIAGGTALTGLTGSGTSIVTNVSPSITTSILPSSAGGANLGSAALPWGTLYLGTAATNNFVFTPAATAAARVVTIPDPGGAANLSFVQVTDCANASACSATQRPAGKIVFGITGVLDGATPATVTVTAMPAFTGTTTYSCSATIIGTGAGHNITNVTNQSSTSTKFYATNGANETVQYVCVGY